MFNEQEDSRVEAEKGRVEAEKGRVTAEENLGSGRVEAEVGRVTAEGLRVSNYKQYELELLKLQADPEHYMTPGARNYFRRVWMGYAILALAIAIGLFTQQRESVDRINDINKSRALITYTGCLDQNGRHDNTIKQLDSLLIVRKAELRKQIKEAEAKDQIQIATSLRAQIDRLDDSRNSTVGLIEALAPHQNCEQLVIDRFGSLPDPQ